MSNQQLQNQVVSRTLQIGAHCTDGLWWKSHIAVLQFIPTLGGLSINMSSTAGKNSWRKGSNTITKIGYVDGLWYCKGFNWPVKLSLPDQGWRKSKQLTHTWLKKQIFNFNIHNYILCICVFKISLNIFSSSTLWAPSGEAKPHLMGKPPPWVLKTWHLGPHVASWFWCKALFRRGSGFLGSWSAPILQVQVVR